MQFTLSSRSSRRARTSAQSAIAVEADTGKIYMKRIQRKKRDGGSIYTLDHLSDFRSYSWKKTFSKDPIKLSEKALALNDIEGAGTLPMEANQYTVEQLLTALF